MMGRRGFIGRIFGGLASAGLVNASTPREMESVAVTIVQETPPPVVHKRRIVDVTSFGDLAETYVSGLK
jgi:hypothetical protein